MKNRNRWKNLAFVLALLLILEGVYYFNRAITIKPHLSGKSDAKCALIADGEVIFDFSGHDEDTHNYGVRLSAWNWVIDGIHVRMAGSSGINVSGSYNSGDCSQNL